MNDCDETNCINGGRTRTENFSVNGMGSTAEMCRACQARFMERQNMLGLRDTLKLADAQTATVVNSAALMSVGARLRELVKEYPFKPLQARKVDEEAISFNLTLLKKITARQ